MKVKGYCTVPEKYRLEIIDAECRELKEETKTETETELKGEFTSESGIKKQNKKKTDSKVKYSKVWELPDKYNVETNRYYGLKGTYEYINERLPLEIQGMISGIINNFDPYRRPPIGRNGITNQSKMWDVKVSDISITWVSFNAWSKKITVKGRTKGSFNEYADQVDFTGKLTIDNPMFHKKEVVELFNKALNYVPLRKIGAHQHGRMVIEPIENMKGN